MKIVQKHKQRRNSIIGVSILIGGLLIFLLLFIGQLRPGLPSTSLAALRSLAQGSAQEELPILIIDMPFGAYDQILGQREKGLTDGVILSSNGDFVPAEIRYEDQSIPVELRLQQGVVEHLGDNDKWNFDGRTRNNQLLSGMQRFYLIDPQDNNWLIGWVFAEALRQENLLAGDYQFVRLFMNGEDKGVYALQEGFGSELISRNGFEEGVIVEFDTSPLLETIAYNEGDPEAVAEDPISNLSASDFRFFEVDTFRDAAVAEDEVLTRQKNRAIGLLRGLQNGELKASEVFDVQKYGRFLALVDLWDANQAVSLNNLRYYYNPQSKLLEPIGFNGNPLSNQQRLAAAATYNDFDIQTSYIEALMQMSSPNYLIDLEEKIGIKVAQIQQVLSFEYEQDLPWEELEKRQTEIKRSLTPLKPVLAYLGPPSTAQEGIIQVDVANMLNYPVEILGFDIDGATFLEVDQEWVRENHQELIHTDAGGLFIRGQDVGNTFPVRYVRFHLPLTKIIGQDQELNFLQEVDIQVATRISGNQNIQMISAGVGYPDPLTIEQGLAPDQE